MASHGCLTPLPNRGREFGRKPAWLCLVLLSLGVTAAFPADAQENPNQRTLGISSESGTQFIEGVTISALDNAPIAGVRLELLVMGGAIRATAFSDKEGRFVFTGLRQSRTYQISARHPDYQEKVERVEIYSTSDYSLRLVLSPRSELGVSAGPETMPVWALQIPADARKEYGRGLEALRKGKAKQAIPLLQAAITLYPDYAGAYGLLGRALLMEADQDAASRAFQKALEIDPKLPEVAYYLGFISSAQGRDEEGLQFLLQAKSLRPEDWRVNFELGQVYLRMGEWAVAEQCLRQAASEPRDSPRLYLLIINALARQEKLPEALAAMNDYLERFPKDKFADQVRGKRELLEAELRKTAAAPPQDPAKQ